MAKSQTHNKQLRTAKELLEARVDAMMDSNPNATTSAPLLPDGVLPDYDLAPDVEPSTDQPPVKTTAEPAAIAPPAIAAPVEAVPTDLPIGPSNDLDTADSDAAIDDIVAQEADEVLAAEDAGVAAARSEAEATTAAPEKQGHPVLWFGVLLLAVLAIIIAAVLVNPNLLPSFG